MKKRALALIFAAFMAASALSACGGTANTDTTSGNTVSQAGSGMSTDNADDTASSSNQSIDVDKNLLSTEITIPAILINSVDDTLASAKEKGYQATANDDGSITYKLSRSQHKQILEDVKQSTQDSVDELLSSGDSESIKQIEFNADYTKATVTVDYDTYTGSFDSLYLLFVGMSGSMYQCFNGVDGDNIHMEISVVDEATGEAKETRIFPDDFVDTSEQ